MTQTEETKNAEALLTSWEQNASAWTEAVRQQKIESRRLVTDQAIIAQALNLNPHKVLDLGCGEGWLTRALSGEGLNVVGIDGSENLISSAKQAGGEYLCLSYEALVAEPERAGSDYELIIANFSLLGEDLAPLLKALRQICVPEAGVLIQTLHPLSAGEPYQNGWRREDFTGFGDSDWEPMPWYFRTLSGWLSLLTDAGLGFQALHEPTHPVSGKPLALMLVAKFLA